MIDSLKHSLNEVKDVPLPFVGIEEHNYALITIHRPSNVDDPLILGNIFIGCVFEDR